MNSVTDVRSTAPAYDHDKERERVSLPGYALGIGARRRLSLPPMNSCASAWRRT